MQKAKVFLIRFLVALLAFQGVLAAQLINVTPAHASDSSVVINEVMWMGSRDSGGHPSDEWIELYNSSTTIQDISGWTLTNTGLNPIPASTTIAPGEYFLIANYLSTSASSVLDVTADLVDSDISLPATCPAGGIELQDIALVTVDQVTCDEASWPAGTLSGSQAMAMERDFPIGEVEAWHDSAGFVNLDADALSFTFASPKFVNDETAVNNTQAIVND